MASTVWGQVVFPPGSALEVPAGAVFDFGCESVELSGTLSAGGTLAGGSLTIQGTGILDGSTGTINVAGNWNNAGTFNAGVGSVNFVDGCSSGTARIDGNTTFNNLSLSSAAGRSFVIPAGSSITVNGTLTLQGAAGRPINLVSSTGQLAQINLGPSAQVVSDAVVFTNVQVGAGLATAEPASIPTLDEWGKALLLLLTAVCGLVAIRRGSADRLS